MTAVHPDPAIGAQLVAPSRNCPIMAASEASHQQGEFNRERHGQYAHVYIYIEIIYIYIYFFLERLIYIYIYRERD